MFAPSPSPISAGLSAYFRTFPPKSANGRNTVDADVVMISFSISMFPFFNIGKARDAAVQHATRTS